MANTYLTWTPSTTPTGSAKTWTYSVWVKMAQENPGYFFAAGSGTQSKFIFGAYGGGDIDILTYEGYVINANTARLFRDTNAWYHVVLACDTTQAVPANGIKLYINGVQETLTLSSVGSENGYTQNTSLRIGTSGEAINIGRDINDSGHWKGCMSHINFVDGQQLTPSTFGETDSTTGEWKIKTSITPGGTGWGTNGFFILKDGNSVTDQSGRGNNFTVANGTLTKTEDSPSNVFATLNALQKLGNSNTSLTYGNTRYYTTSSAWGNITSTLGFSSGKFYVEGKIMTLNSSTGYGSMGIIDSTRATQTTGNESFTATGNTAGIVFDYRSGQSNFYSGGNTVSSNIGDFSNNDIIGMAIDMDNKALYIHKAGTYYQVGGVTGVPTSGASKTGAITIPAGVETCMIAMGSYTSAADFCYNFGNGYFLSTAVSSAGTNASGIGIFEYDVPTGYTALSTKGLNL